MGRSSGGEEVIILNLYNYDTDGKSKAKDAEEE
nr:MAG: hypothetical protein [Bacteriophage sp.]